MTQDQVEVLTLIRAQCGYRAARSVELAWEEGLPHSIPAGLDEDSTDKFKAVDPGFIAKAKRLANPPKWKRPFGNRPIV